MDPAHDQGTSLSRLLAVQSKMFFPDDVRLAAQFPDGFLGYMANAALDQIPSGSIENSLLSDREKLLLHEYARKFLISDLPKETAFEVTKVTGLKDYRGEKSVDVGSIVGFTILIPMFAKFNYGRDDVGRHEAWRIMLDTGDKEDPRGKRTLQNIWSRYQSVAHFWAAWSMFDLCVLNSLEEVTFFLSVAELTRQWAEEFIPLNGKEPLLDKNKTWKMPSEWIAGFSLDLSQFKIPAAWKARLLREG
jgi:hypothetical protein